MRAASKHAHASDATAKSRTRPLRIVHPSHRPSVARGAIGAGACNGKLTRCDAADFSSREPCYGGLLPDRRSRRARIGRRGEAAVHLQLDRFHRPQHHREIRAAHRHQGDLRRLRRRGDHGGAADGGQLRLRRGERIDRFLQPRNQGRRLRDARQIQAAELEESRSAYSRDSGGLRPGQCPCGAVSAFHQRLCLQRRHGQGAHAERAGRQPRHAVQAGGRREVRRLRRDVSSIPRRTRCSSR